MGYPHTNVMIKRPSGFRKKHNVASRALVLLMATTVPRNVTNMIDTLKHTLRFFHVEFGTFLPLSFGGSNGTCSVIRGSLKM